MVSVCVCVCVCVCVITYKDINRTPYLLRAFCSHKMPTMLVIRIKMNIKVVTNPTK